MISPNPATKTSEPPPKDAAQESPLVEGVDYYLEAGRWVFTADYHKRRGHCCKSGCRHCPYGFSVERATDK